MTTQTASASHTSDVQVPLLKRFGMAAYRLLLAMSESAYQGCRAQLTAQYGAI